MQTQSKANNMMVLPVIAGVVGAGLGILFAPRSGKETRERLKQRNDDMMGKAKEGIDTAKQRAHAVRGKTKDVADTAKDAMQDTKEDLKATADNTKARAQTVARESK